MEKQTIQRPTGLGLSAYDMLLERLMSLQFRAGDRISVDKLSRELGISQTPIREALGKLEAQRLIVKTHLLGYHVAPNLTMKEYEDLYEIRRMIEPKAAAKAAQRAPASALEELSAHVRDMRVLPATREREAYNRFARGDVEFHTLIASASGSRFLEDTVASWSLQLHLFRRGYYAPWVAAVAEEHDTILTAIRNKEPEEAEQAMIIHLEHSYQRHRDTI